MFDYKNANLLSSRINSNLLNLCSDSGASRCFIISVISMRRHSGVKGDTVIASTVHNIEVIDEMRSVMVVLILVRKVNR